MSRERCAQWWLVGLESCAWLRLGSARVLGEFLIPGGGPAVAVTCGEARARRATGFGAWFPAGRAVAGGERKDGRGAGVAVRVRPECAGEPGHRAVPAGVVAGAAGFWGPPVGRDPLVGEVRGLDGIQVDEFQLDGVQAAEAVWEARPAGVAEPVAELLGSADMAEPVAGPVVSGRS
ncbi:hypothetical protein [Nonomuraea sp. NPDC050691]|uniref:hypothetical protein n=1 Tax=Nonomuraea sp. NPDC050691 TaxID=3155661 RepID=UPI0033CCA980